MVRTPGSSDQVPTWPAELIYGLQRMYLAAGIGELREDSGELREDSGEQQDPLRVATRSLGVQGHRGYASASGDNVRTRWMWTSSLRG